MICLDGIWKSFAGQPALRGVSLSVGHGDAVLLTGPSGAGKTTLLRLIFAAERPDRGELLVAGRNLARLRASSIPYVRRNIGVVFQDFKLLADRTARDNVAMPLQILGLGGRELRARALAALDAVGLAAKAEARTSSLSGGEQQRVAVARAIVGEPAILLADEPTGNLDPARARDLLALFDAIHQRGTTLLLATHDPAVVDSGPPHGGRGPRPVAGALPAAPLPPARPARHDDETDRFAPGADDTEVVHLVRA
jgi:cell division transport system ATP-binding protein